MVLHLCGAASLPMWSNFTADPSLRRPLNPGAWDESHRALSRTWLRLWKRGCLCTQPWGSTALYGKAGDGFWTSHCIGHWFHWQSSKLLSNGITLRHSKVYTSSPNNYTLTLGWIIKALLKHVAATNQWYLPPGRQEVLVDAAGSRSPESTTTASFSAKREDSGTFGHTPSIPVHAEEHPKTWMLPSCSEISSIPKAEPDDLRSIKRGSSQWFGTGVPELTADHGRC